MPIAAAYAFAHYFTLVIFEGQSIISAGADPFGLGWNLFGGRNYKIDFFLGAIPVWYIQLATIVAGHVAGVVLAHDRAIHDWQRPRRGPLAVRDVDLDGAADRPRSLHPRRLAGQLNSVVGALDRRTQGSAPL